MDKTSFLEKWQGKVLVTGAIEAITGLHIGGSQGGLDIGGVDNIIIRQQISGRPYIPGSSLKGKIRSLIERSHGKRLVQVIGGRNPIYQHRCEGQEPCEVCKVFGLPGQEAQSEPTRLIVRDSHLLDELYVTGVDGSRSLRNWSDPSIRTDLPFSETKTEVAIDRVTSAASPRQVERVPAGARFGYSLVFDIYDDTDRDYLSLVFEGMRLLENDYIGGYGTRGSGQVRFESVEITWRSKPAYASGQPGQVLARELSLADIAGRFDTEIKAKLNGAA